MKNYSTHQRRSGDHSAIKLKSRIFSARKQMDKARRVAYMKNISAVVSVFILVPGCPGITSVSAEPEMRLSLSKCPSGYFVVITGNYNSAPKQHCFSEAPETITIPVGAALSITLPANPTTGAAWGLRHMPDSVMLLSAGYSPSPASETGLSGSGGGFSYTFRAMVQGSGIINLGYGQPWENEAWSTRIINIKTR